MEFNTSIAMNIILFLALFGMAFFWLRRAWRIIVKKDYSEVALKRGEPPENPKRYAPYTAGVNLIGGFVVVGIILGVLVFQLHFNIWSAWAGSTLWMKIFADFIVSRQARPFVFKKKADKAE
jgi:hypothetical protein